jgi:hypothetical protein
MGSEGRTLSELNAAEIAQWCQGSVVTEHDALDHDRTQPAVNVQCGDIVKRARLGDMVIRKNDGTFDVFQQPKF